jgi:hypothetical protein
VIFVGFLKLCQVDGEFSFVTPFDLTLESSTFPVLEVSVLGLRPVAAHLFHGVDAHDADIDQPERTDSEELCSLLASNLLLGVEAFAGKHLL